MSDEHKDKAVGKTLANFGDFLAENKVIIVAALVAVGTSLLVGYFDGWETVLMMIGGSIVPSIFAVLWTQKYKELFWRWSVIYCCTLGGNFLV
jgi:hypothetical protein